MPRAPVNATEAGAVAPLLSWCCPDLALAVTDSTCPSCVDETVNIHRGLYQLCVLLADPE